jgi:hypothetical protein
MKTTIATIFTALFLVSCGNQNKPEDYNKLAQRQDVSELSPVGEIAAMFNLNSKYTDIQRSNKLKEIKGKVVVWEVKVYEIKKDGEGEYKIQSKGGFNFDDSNDLPVGMDVKLHTRNPEEVKFIEAVKTDDVIRIKGILTGEISMRYLEIEPAILWYPETKKVESPVAEDSKTNKQVKETPEQCYQKWYDETRKDSIAEMEKSGNKGPYDEMDLVPMGMRQMQQEACGVK